MLVKYKRLPIGLIRAHSSQRYLTPSLIGYNQLSVRKFSNGNKPVKPIIHELKQVEPTKPESKNALSSTMSTLQGAWASTVSVVKNPKKAWKAIKEEALHYWLGSKLLWSEMKLTTQILRRVLSGHQMTRRERIQLIRTTNDMFRLVPFAVFVIVPFMEFLLPFALKVFPNMLPSTFQDSLKKEESMKKELQMRLAFAGFFQDALKELVKKKGGSSNEGNGEKSTSAKELVEFIERSRLGEQVPNDSVIRIAQLFQDELTLDNIARPQLTSLCEYMGLPPYGSDSFLRYQIRSKISKLREDDRRILWEGIDSLTIDELRDACRDRGMRSVGLTHFGYRRQLQDWMDLSIRKNIPMSLLIMSRAFNITSKAFHPEEVLRSSISSLTDDTINEVVLAAAMHDEVQLKDLQKRKLESLQFQTELIDEETTEFNTIIAAKAAAAEEKATVSEADANKNEATKLPSSGSSQSLPVIEEKKDKMKLSVQEVEALGDLARGSSVVREKAELAKLQAHVELVEIERILTGAKETISQNQSAEHKPTSRELEAKNLHSVLNTMVDKLKTQIDKTELALGDTFNILDKDGDGELSSEELKDALSKILKSAKSEQEAEDIVRMLDKDGDGKISVIELLQYVESRRHSLEVENQIPDSIQENSDQKKL